MKFQGKVWKFGDNIDTDLIIPARYLNISDGSELAKSCFIDIRPDFAEGVSYGDILVAGRNFGCGSSREHAPLAIKKAGISIVIAKSFARIFYRNAFNIGLPIIESEGAVEGLSEGEEAAVDLANGNIESIDNGTIFSTHPIPGFMRELISAGGLVNYIRSSKINI
ncbi:MAG: 3-isopropylmalate dehydratase small subunit [Syntrophobacterales bacterium]|nr:3-isopropylmalate dehydratase small subunit [Syntrophobacterales bacterium]